MALSLRKNSSRGTVGLDIDGRYLAAVQSENGQLQRAASRELAPGALVDGEVADGAALAGALKAFFQDNDLPKSVRLGVANQQIVVRQIEVPRIDNEKERDAAVQFQAAEAIAMPLDDAVLDYQVTGETTDDGPVRQKVVVVAARRKMIGDLIEAVRAAGLKPQGIDLDAFALVRMLASPAPTDEVARVYCHLATVTNLAIAIGSSCLFTRALSTSLEGDAEHGVAELADEIRLSIDYYMAQPGARPVNDIVLSGPNSSAGDLSDRLAAAIGMPVSVAPPLGPHYAGGLPAGDDPFRYTVAAGLAVGEAA
jgi:type IV pilus assembly protein PilM